MSLIEKIKNLFKNPSNKDLEVRISQLEAEMNAFQIDIWDYVDEALRPLSKRVARKLRKSDEEDLNISEELPKRAIISQSESLRMLGHGKR